MNSHSLIQMTHLQARKCSYLEKNSAFAMDMILLVVLLQLLVQFLPNAYSDQAKQEFGQLIIDAEPSFSGRAIKLPTNYRVS